MCDTEKKPMGCKSYSWIKENTLLWYHATVYHYNVPSYVRGFCGVQCRFPACLEQISGEDEAEKEGIDVLTNTGETSERQAALPLFNKLRRKEKVGQG